MTKRKPKPRATAKKREDLLRHAVAIASTDLRYRTRCMSRPTWQAHMRHLWARAEDAGLDQDVKRLLGHARLYAGV